MLLLAGYVVPKKKSIKIHQKILLQIVDNIPLFSPDETSTGIAHNYNMKYKYIYLINRTIEMIF